MRILVSKILSFLLYKLYDLIQESLYRRGQAGNDCFSFGAHPYMLMVRERAGLVVRSVVVPEQELPLGILAVIAVLGFHQSWFGLDEFHHGELNSLGKQDSSLHKTNVRSTLVLGKGRLHHMRVGSKRLLQTNKVLVDQQTSVSFSNARALVSSW